MARAHRARQRCWLFLGKLLGSCAAGAVHRPAVLIAFAVIQELRNVWGDESRTLSLGAKPGGVSTCYGPPHHHPDEKVREIGREGIDFTVGGEEDKDGERETESVATAQDSLTSVSEFVVSVVTFFSSLPC